MKKTAYLFASLLMVFAVAESYASIQLNALPSTKFVRATGEPKTDTKTFSGIGGAAKIKLINGDLSDTTVEKVSSSEIKVNGILVFGPSDFNQKVSALEKDINLSDGTNTLSVLLKGKPGGTVSIQIIQSLDNIKLDPSIIRLLEEGATSQIAVTGELSNGKVVNITGPSFGTTYSSLSPEVAAVSPSGLVTAVANGNTNIWITNGSFGASLPVTVQITHSTRTVGQEGGTLKFHNGLVLEIPPGAVPGSTPILIKDLPLDQVTAILSNPLLSPNHTKRLLGGFTAEPDGLVFNQPVLATIPVLPLNPQEKPAHIEIFLSEQRYRYVTSQFDYWGDQGVAKVNIKHFSSQGIVGAANIDCTGDAPSPPDICTWTEEQHPCMRNYHAEAIAVDFENDLCSLVADTIKLTFYDCPGSPTVLYSLAENTCADIDMKMTIEPDLHSVAVGKQAEFKAFITGTWNKGPAQGEIAFSHKHIDPIWSSDAPSIADFVGQTGLIEGKQSNPDPVKVWAKVSEGSDVRDNALVRVGDHIEIRPAPPYHGLDFCPGEEKIFEAVLKDAADNYIMDIQVNWLSSKENVAKVVSPSGKTTVIKGGVAEGAAYITAESEIEGLFPATVQVTVSYESAKINITSYQNGDKAYASGANLVGTIAECGTRRVAKLTVSRGSFIGSVDVGADGTFAIPVPLDWGINHFRFSTYDSDGDRISNNMDGVDFTLRRVPHCLKSDSTLQLPIKLYGTPVTYTSLRPLIASVDPVTGVVTGHANGWAPITTMWRGSTIVRWVGVSSTSDYVPTYAGDPFYQPRPSTPAAVQLIDPFQFVLTTDLYNKYWAGQYIEGIFDNVCHYTSGSDNSFWKRGGYLYNYDTNTIETFSSPDFYSGLSPRDVNEIGQVVGSIDTDLQCPAEIAVDPSYKQVGFIYSAGALINIQYPGAFNTVLHYITNDGFVAGAANNEATGLYTAFIYDIYGGGFYNISLQELSNLVLNKPAGEFYCPAPQGSEG